MQIAGEADNAGAVPESCRRVRAHIAIMNIDLPGEPLETILRDLKLQLPTTIVLLTGAYVDVARIAQLMAYDAAGFVPEDHFEHMAEAIQVVAGGGTWFPSAVLRSLLDYCAHKPRPRIDTLPPFTPRQRTVLDALVAGHTNKEIAAQLKITERTVEFHLQNIYQLLDLTTRTEVAVWAAHNLSI